MDRPYIVANHIVDRYLAGQLSEQETQEFELYYIEHPEMLEELHMQEAFRDALVCESELLTENIANQSPETFSRADAEPSTNWLNRLLSPRPLLAFSGVLSAAVVALLVQNNALRGDDISMISGYQTIVLQETRGVTDSTLTRKLDDLDQQVRLVIELGPIGYESVTVRIVEPEQHLIWSQQTPFNNEAGTVELVLNAHRLGLGSYQIQVFPDDKTSAKPLTTHQLRITDPIN